MKTLTVTRRDVRIGDRLVNGMGQPFFQVERIDQARAKGYLVFSGKPLLKGVDMGQGGHALGTVVIAREDGI